MATHPTVVVGTGQAGIKTMSKIHEVATENDDQNRFKYIAIDTDKDTLNLAPTEASQITLDLDSAFLQEDIQQYPYLVDSMSIEGTGAKRQRPVGRYKVDRRGNGGYDDVFESLSQEIEDHHQNIDVQLAPDTASFNIFFIHSFGGGTGSGTYPLLLSMLDDIAQNNINESDEVVYLAGVGVVPEITFDPEHKLPPGDTHDYYPNSYAALEDLKNFVDLHDPENKDELELKLWAKTIGKTSKDRITDEEVNTFDFKSVPFDDYWLVGVHEDKIGGGAAGRAGPESYAEELNQTMARAIHAISKLNNSAENWSQGTPYTGTFSQAEISVPHEQVEQLVEQQNDREAKQERIEEGIPAEITEFEDRKEELDSLKRDLSPEGHADDDLEREIETYLEENGFRGGNYIVENKSAADIRSTLDEIEAEFPIEGLIIATERLRDQLQEERGAPSVEEDWKDTIQEIWSKYDLQAESQYGGGSVKTLEGRASVAEEYLGDKIDEFVEMKDEWDPSMLERLQDWAPPIAGPLESEREYAESWLDALQDDLSDLERVMATWGRVSDMMESLEDRRADIRGQIDDQISDINEEITALQNERDELEKEIRRLENSIESLRKTLTEETVNERIAVLPLQENKIDDIDDVVLDTQLTSLAAYVDEGYVDEKKLRYALNDRLDFCQAWEEDIVDREFSRTDEESLFQPQDEIWYLFHEDNREFQNRITESPDAQEIESGPRNQSTLQYLSDPYRIEYISYTRRGPISALKIYQSFEDLEADGWLQRFANQYEDYRQAFAYLEWYGRDIKKVFDVRAHVKVPQPPELDRTLVTKPEMDEGELKNYIKVNGLDAYLWNGNMWDDYDAAAASGTFRGWKRKLTKHNITFTDIQRATPDSRKKSEWLAGQRDWEEILEAYQQNLIKREETKIIFEDE